MWTRSHRAHGPRPMSAWSDLGGGLRVRQSRCYAMNSFMAQADGHTLLVDPGVLPSELDELAAATQAQSPDLNHVSIAFTHPHWDHVLGLPWFPAAETFAHSGFHDALEQEAATIDRRAREGLAAHDESLPHTFRAFEPILKARGTTRVELGPFTLVTYDTPGHDPNHLSLWLPEHGVLVAGDLLSAIEIPWLDGPPWVYRSTLKQLHWLYEQEDVRVTVPGHGPLAHGRLDGYRRLLRDMDYLAILEERVRAAWTRGLPLAATQQELAAMDYTGKDAAYAMNEVHADNVRFTWQALANGDLPGVRG